MTPSETAAVLAQLPDDAEITVTVRLCDWLAAKQAVGGGPEYAGAAEVARLIGFSGRYWSEKAKRGLIAGAVQEASSGRWRLPVEACRAHIRGLGRRAPAPATRPLAIVRGKARVPHHRAP